MKARLSCFLFFTVVRTFALPVEDLSRWIDSTFQNHGLNWTTVEAEFKRYTADNYKACNSIASFNSLIIKQHPKNWTDAYNLNNANDYPALESVGASSHSILKQLENHLFDLIVRHKLYEDQNLFTYTWIYIHQLNLLPLNAKQPYTMSGELMRLNEFMGVEQNSFEKIAMVILIRKIFLENQYKNASELFYVLPALKPVYVNTEEAKTHGDIIQTDSVNYAEVEPLFIGGYKNLSTFIQLNVFYPEKAREMGESGIVYVQFVIEKDGSISNVEIFKGVSEALDQEAFRVISAMPKWIPGIQDNKNVKVKFTLPINFRLS